MLVYECFFFFKVLFLRYLRLLTTLKTFYASWSKMLARLAINCVDMAFYSLFLLKIDSSIGRTSNFLSYKTLRVGEMTIPLGVVVET